MPEKQTLERARRDKRAGKAGTTQAGEFVREEIHHVREGKHGARSTKQAIAIGLSKARRAGISLPRPPASAKATTKRSAQSASQAAKTGKRPSARRSRAVRRALKRERGGGASSTAVSRQAKRAARPPDTRHGRKVPRLAVRRHVEPRRLASDGGGTTRPHSTEPEMRIRDIARDSWREALDGFSRQHEGWVVSVTTRTINGDVAVAARDVPLQGIGPASPRSDDLAIIVGGSRGHLTHEVRDPATVQIELTADEAERALIIQDKDGTTTTVEFRSPMRSEEVDGLPSYDHF
jgi:Family of unknown function (DUF5335)/Family of unknown function (DUF6496)